MALSCRGKGEEKVNVFGMFNISISFLLSQGVSFLFWWCGCIFGPRWNVAFTCTVALVLRTPINNSYIIRCIRVQWMALVGIKREISVSVDEKRNFALRIEVDIAIAS